MSLENFEIITQVGEGAYGTVYKAIEKKSCRTVALKQQFHVKNEHGAPTSVIREIAVLNDLRHPSIVGLLDVFLEKNKLFLILEFLDQDLRKFLDSCLACKRVLDPRLIKSYLYQLLRALDFCHGQRILHRDIKPQNLLIDQSGRLKLADFGLSRVCVPPHRFSQEVVTLWYRAPELLLGVDVYSTAVDIWSAGCVFAEMVNITPLLPGKSEMDQLAHIFKSFGTPCEEKVPAFTQMPNFNPSFPQCDPVELSTMVPHLDSEGLGLLEKMLQLDPTDRMECTDALDHAYFEDFDKSILDVLDSGTEIIITKASKTLEEKTSAEELDRLDCPTFS
eukprot:CAMPEP_0117785230 /NCGR_PEP_ID=MMETSP0948-20121206/5143_1 /TAXON_ID=44440 /ORGANISM="Chattonella subsalsa, Strain CCMP2191" /LENGTH=333 /DNA_ID=CAMNT_0005614063 /DNA_START=12 /DNA_END=1013 /DNA_ORIENTATION=+